MRPTHMSDMLKSIPAGDEECRFHIKLQNV
jgi:hypothetical protein